MYEPLFGEKAFPYDWHVGEYAAHRSDFELPSLPAEMDERIKCYITEILYRMFEIDWWKRPSARELLQVLNSLSQDSTEFYILDRESGKCIRHIRLYHDNHTSWETVRWNRYWYIPDSVFGS